MGESHEKLADDLKRSKIEADIVEHDNRREREEAEAQERRDRVVDKMREQPWESKWLTRVSFKLQFFYTQLNKFNWVFFYAPTEPPNKNS